MKIETPTFDEKCFKLQQLLQTLLAEPGDYAIGVEGLTLYRREAENKPQAPGRAQPHATIVFQGAERVILNGREFQCGQCQCRLTSKEAFGTGYIAEASSEQPFLAASLQLNPGLLKELSHIYRLRTGAALTGLDDVCVETAGADMLDAFFRLLMLHKKPVHIPVLAPLIIYEIHYLLAAGAGGNFN